MAETCMAEIMDGDEAGISVIHANSAGEVALRPGR